MFHSLLHLLARLSPRRRAAASSPHRTAPRVESLEDRVVPSAIGGTVYQDVGNTGQLFALDPRYADNPIALLDASGKQIATTTTDANGNYLFTINQTIDTGPAVKEQDLTFGPATTNNSLTKSFAQFDPSLGTLTSVEIVTDATLTDHAKIESLDAAPATVDAEINGTFTLTGQGLDPVKLLVADNPTANVAAYDGSGALDFKGANSVDFGSKDVKATKTINLDASTNDLAAFKGTGTTSLTEATQVTACGCGAGNLLAMINTTSTATVKVIYHYTPSNALTPGTYTVVQTANPPGTVDGHNTSNGVPVPPGTPADTIPVTLPPGGDSLQNNFGEVTPPPPVVPPVTPPPPVVPPVTPPPPVAPPPVTPPVVFTPPPAPPPAVTPPPDFSKGNFLGNSWEWGW